jgi:hypothetical protein
MKFTKQTALAILSYAVISPSVSFAAATVYTDKSAFLAATAATSATGSLPNLGLLNIDSITLGSVTATEIIPPNPIGSSIGLLDWSTRLPGNELVFSFESFDYTVVTPVFALGFDIVEPQFDPNINAPFVDSTFTITLRLGATAVDGPFILTPPNDTVAFWGVASIAPFDRVEIRETVGTDDNEFFGQVYTSNVPEPSTAGLLAIGALVCTRRPTKSPKRLNG